MKNRKAGCLLLLLLLCLVLTGCRTRTTGKDASSPGSENQQGAAIHPQASGSRPDGGSEPSEPDDGQNQAESSGRRTRENPEASRKEYDENAPAEIVPGTDQAVHGDGEGNGSFAQGNSEKDAVSKLSDTAEETAEQTVAADEAEQAGVSEDAAEADSAMTYYTVLLADRMGSLFECQRMHVYWETAEDHVTIHKTSPEHSLILNAGAYDISARLLPENLHVDDGWISRKNPGVIVKLVNSGILGRGVSSTAAAQKVYADLLSREGWLSVDAVRNRRVILLSEELMEAPHLQLAAMLAIARTGHPDLLADLEPDKALEMLSTEATGSIPTGIYYYHGGAR